MEGERKYIINVIITLRIVIAQQIQEGLCDNPVEVLIILRNEAYRAALLVSRFGEPYIGRSCESGYCRTAFADGTVTTFVAQ